MMDIGETKEVQARGATTIRKYNDGHFSYSHVISIVIEHDDDDHHPVQVLYKAGVLLYDRLPHLYRSTVSILNAILRSNKY